jgi:hypothetical protein
MKPSWEWAEDDLLSMKATQTEESLSFEVKRSQALERSDKNKRELSKDISAFANAVGGDIIYGVAEIGTSPSRFGDIDDGIDPTTISPEWVEQVLTSNIQPKIEGLRVHPIELRTSKPGRYAYVVHVPMSNKVHQASDKRYYKRFNFESVPMDDNEIRDLQNQREKPVLKVYCEVAKARLTSFSKFETWPTFFLGIRLGPVRIPSFDLNIALINSGVRAAKHAQAILSFDNLRIRKMSGLAARIDELREDKQTLQWSSFESVVHADSALRIMELSFIVLNMKENCTIKTEVVAEEVPRVTHEYIFNSSGLILASFKDTNGKKLMVSLDQLEHMFK